MYLSPYLLAVVLADGSLPASIQTECNSALGIANMLMNALMLVLAALLKRRLEEHMTREEQKGQQTKPKARRYPVRKRKPKGKASDSDASSPDHKK